MATHFFRTDEAYLDWAGRQGPPASDPDGGVIFQSGATSSGSRAGTDPPASPRARLGLQAQHHRLQRDRLTDLLNRAARGETFKWPPARDGYGPPPVDAHGRADWAAGMRILTEEAERHDQCERDLKRRAAELDLIDRARFAPQLAGRFA